MNDDIKDLITAIAEGDSVAIENSFNSVMAQKISDRLDSMRIDVAGTMFGESYDDDDVSRADSELRKMGKKPIKAAKIDTSKDKIKLTKKDKEEMQEEFSLEDFSIEELEEMLVSEELEELDEISKSTKLNYLMKAIDSKKKLDKNAKIDKDRMDKEPEDAAWKWRHDYWTRKSDNRAVGIKKTTADLTKEDVSYSAKEAHAGKDIGKPGKNFKKIADSAAKKYGSEEAGKRVAGAVLAKLRKEEIELDEAE